MSATIDTPENKPSENPTDPPLSAGDTDPLFAEAFPNGDILLISRDEVRFPISSSTLRRTSGWFKSAFTLPQSPATGTPEPISMDEPAPVLASLLSLIAALGIPDPSDLDHLEAVAFAADKYDMPMPLAVLRELLARHVPAAPLRVYGLASRLGWTADAARALRAALAVNVFAPPHAGELARLDAPALAALLAVLERRRAALAEKLESETLFTANLWRRRCVTARCGELEDHTTWWAFKLAWVREPWRFFGLRDGGTVMWEVPELQTLLRDTCVGCKRQLYSEESTLENLREIARGLPEE
ncbi:uncharacterized protein BXZ73DRAFT_88661 [Epithele typhae]|uniref:uncharacterized protein n=1 Tax=Epithele typhae TaxID=378194 RepID=UPI002007E4AF|nr:uncharacterized protein BXZ73DRAFT_88661 [Epithele typhae]KAH9940408.1 hypothetical protein BXZ73DRAFT_88661 [Epithele typhae]